jgi:hypothetical protein
MALNPYFDNKKVLGTQRLIDDMTREVIKATGIDVIYIAKTTDKLDAIFGENPLGKLKNAFTIEMYSQNVKTFDGNERDIVTKFGMELKDNVSLLVSRSRWYEEASKLPEDFPNRLHPRLRPMEGDIIFLPYAPSSRNLYEIKLVENENMFYQQGDYYTFRLDCELYKYDMGDIQTGFDEIDKSTQGIISTITDSNGTYQMNTLQPNNNTELQTNGNDFIDFTEIDPFSEGRY